MVLSLTLRAGLKTRIGGFDPKALKKLNGLRFITPLLLMVLAKAMGRGATAPSISAWSSPVLICPGITFMVDK